MLSTQQWPEPGSVPTQNPARTEEHLQKDTFIQQSGKTDLHWRITGAIRNLIRII